MSSEALFCNAIAADSVISTDFRFPSMVNSLAQIWLTEMCRKCVNIMSKAKVLFKLRACENSYFRRGKLWAQFSVSLTFHILPLSVGFSYILHHYLILYLPFYRSNSVLVDSYLTHIHNNAIEREHDINMHVVWEGTGSITSILSDLIYSSNHDDRPTWRCSVLFIAILCFVFIEHETNKWKPHVFVFVNCTMCIPDKGWFQLIRKKFPVLTASS